MASRKHWLAVGLFFLALELRGEDKCPVSLEQKAGAFQVGVQAMSILPNRLPQFTSSVPVYGPIVGIPVLGQLVQLQATYGTLTGFTLHTFEASYRYQFALPVASPFLQVGAHYLRYRYRGQNHTYLGANAGLGFSFDMNESFDIDLLIKVHQQDRSLLSFGAGIMMLL